MFENKGLFVALPMVAKIYVRGNDQTNISLCSRLESRQSSVRSPVLRDRRLRHDRRFPNRKEVAAQYHCHLRGLYRPSHHGVLATASCSPRRSPGPRCERLVHLRIMCKLATALGFWVIDSSVDTDAFL